MNKFKVGDKVGNQHVNYLGEIIEVINVELSKVRVYDGVISVYMNEALVKTPHQELLDLGWIMTVETNNFISYEIEEENLTSVLGINKLVKKYYIDVDKKHLVHLIDLQLAKILVRYLEELE